MEPAGPEPEPGAGAGPEPGAEEIDMSLDDIIKRHRKGQTGAKLVGDKRRQQVKNRNSAYGNGRPRFRTWMQRNLQGPNRFRRGFGQQQYNRRPFRSAMAGPRGGVAATLNGASPLNRQALAQEGNQHDEALTKSSDSGQPEAQRWLPQRPKRFRTAGVPGQAPARRPFPLNRRPAFQQRQSKVSFTRGVSVPQALQTEPRTEGKRPWMRRWQLQPSSGAVLTISVCNPQASHTNMPGGKRPFLRGRRPPPRTAKPQPRGVPLRFNFRAMANQTSLTLDERFSGLRNKRRFTAARNSSRTVMLP
ncbi:UAP56-interacting factor-like [Mauremys reevesii]|uniref:UAP56-interacting factor-like n=1 Tax=Mauremys reevesii TaxID=260615 RepID=UPI00193F2DE8|nr:UAP56-interacting factor-like [Mauremys reevesii]